MKISDETLMAFADDELDATSKAEVEAAMRDDPHIAGRIDEHRALRSRMQRAYAQDLEEMPPQRLIAAARGAKRIRPKASRSRTWLTGLSIAASLAIGIGVGAFVVHPTTAVMLSRSGGLVAGATLEQVLSEQLGTAGSSSGIAHVGLSFVGKAGEYCRTFTLTTVQAPAGLACRREKEWQIQAWAESSEGTAIATGQEYRTASSPLPPDIVRAVEERIAGEPLDRAGEAAALRRGWQRTNP